MEDVKLEDAFGMLDCMPSKTNIMSTSVSNAAEVSLACNRNLQSNTVKIAGGERKL